MTIFPLPVWAVAVFATFALIFATPAHAAPIAEIKNGEVRLVLHNDPCALDATSNTPYRATYEERGKVHEGCWGMNEYKIAHFYFASDKTVFGIPLSEFKKVATI